MNKFVALLASAFWLFVALNARAADDEIRLKPSGRTGGVVRSTSPIEVTVEIAAGVSKQIPVGEIESIAYAAEPPQLKLVRSAVANSNFESALANLEKINVENVSRAEIKQDLQFYRALCRSRLALAGNGDIRDAGKMMLDFVNGNKDSYHYLAASQVLGDLLAAVGKYDLAYQRYDAVEKAPWPDYKRRATIAKGRVLAAQQKFAEAQAAFEKVLAEPANPKDEQLEKQRLAATLGKAECMAQAGQFEPAIKMVEDVVEKASPEDADLNGRAYVTLGNCLRKKPGGTKAAILAFLHVDLLYNANREAHAEALANLKNLWNEDGKPERAMQAAQLLKQRYANSSWAK